MEQYREFWLTRLLYGRNNRDAPDSGPFATDALVVFAGLALLAFAAAVPVVGLPLFVLFVVVAVLRYRKGRP